LLRISWEELLDLVDSLVDKIKIQLTFEKQDVKVSEIHYVPRGGMVIARLLSGAFKVPKIFPAFVRKPEGFAVVVDEVVDSGKTCMRVKQFYRDTQYLFVVLHLKPYAMCLPHCWVAEVDEWVQYPWEVFD